jgi:uncharacterized protein YbjT (DUF2867 family)
MRRVCLLFLLVFTLLPGCTSGPSNQSAAGGAERILVLGASGRSGRYIIAELAKDGRNFIAATSNVERARENAGADYNWIEVDVRDPASVRAAMTDVTHVISALGATSFEGENGPEFVDYMGVRNVVDAALEADVRRMVLISASGVTNRDHPLNKLGNVMVWKLKGEDHLRDSGLPYTIIRPGGLLDKDAGQFRIVLRQGDDLPYTSKLSVTTRGDLALLCLAALDAEEFRNVTLEAFNDRTQPADDAWKEQLAQLTPG